MARKYPATFTEGDRIAYSVQFLRSIGASHGELPRLRGTIAKLREVSHGTVWATIEWDNDPEGELPGTVNVASLAKVGANPRFANID